MNQTQRRFAWISVTLMIIIGMLAPAVSYPGATASAVSGAGIAPLTFDAPASPAAPEDDYTIAGRVTDSLGNPVPGVTISAATVSTPIVFVHGFGGLGVGMVSGIGCTDDDRTRRIELEDANDYFGPLDDLIAQHRPVFYARLVSNPCFTPHLSDNVPWLIEAIDQAKQSTGQSKVIIIAHSMGGVISRAYIEGNGYRNDVESLFTLGSPHHGVPHDILSFAANGFTAILDWPFDWGTFCEDRQPGMCDFSLIGMSIFNHYHRLNRDVKYYFLTGDPPTISRNPLGLATDALFLLTPNDGIIGQTSGIGATLPPTGAWNSRYTNDENHNIFGRYALYDWPYFGPRRDLFSSTESKVYTECLKPVLVDGTATSCSGTWNLVVAEENETDQSTTDTFSRSPIESGIINAGDTITRTISIDGGEALFTSQWLTGTLTMTLVSPSNQVVDPDYAENNPSIVTYTSLETSSAYSLSQAESGEWKLVLTAGQEPSSGNEFSTLAGFETVLTFTAGSDRSWYSPGMTATITATLGATTTNTMITGSVTTDLTTIPIQLNPIGNNEYQASYTIPNDPGEAVVWLMASGINQDNLPFEREQSFIFQIAPDTISLLDQYSERVIPRSAGSSFFEALEIDVETQVLNPGTFGLSADLVDGDGRVVAHAFVIQELNTGDQTLTLEFGAEDIYQSSSNGPYILTNLLFTDRSKYPLIVAEEYNVYSTGAYDFRQFGNGNIYLPIITSLINGYSTKTSREASSQISAFTDGTEISSVTYTAVTDAEGYYTLSSLPPGSYTVTPYQSGKTFNPVQQVVNLPPNIVTIDFTCTNCSPAPMSSIELVTTTYDGGLTDSHSTTPDISVDKRFITFDSWATNLVQDGFNLKSVYIRDMQTGTNEIVSVSTTNQQTSGENSSISADGRFVAFDSSFSNLVLGDTNNSYDIFVRDRQSQQTERISVSSNEDQANGGSWLPAISDDGRFVAFNSTATNLVAGDTNNNYDIFVRDRQTGTTERVSIASDGTQSNSSSRNPAISADGRFIVFQSQASNLVAGDTNGVEDIFLHDRQTHTTERLSLSTLGAQGNHHSQFPSISSDGRYVVFQSFANNLAPNDTNLYRSDIFLRDRQLGTTELISRSLTGTSGNDWSANASVSDDGRWVAFASVASNLVPDDTNGLATDIFINDRQSEQIWRISVSTDSLQANGSSDNPRISADGSAVVFDSQASNLVDGDINGVKDIFINE